MPPTLLQELTLNLSTISWDLMGPASAIVKRCTCLHAAPSGQCLWSTVQLSCTEMRRKVQDFQLSRSGLHSLSRVKEGLHRDARWLNESTTLSFGAKDLSECKAVMGDDYSSHEV